MFSLSSLRSALQRCSLVGVRQLQSSSVAQRFNQPKSGNDLTRAGGIATAFRLPLQENQPEGLDVAIVGIPMDNGTSNRSGTRMGPRSVRVESSIIRAMNITGASPFSSLQVADIGDVPVVPYNLRRTIDIITEYYNRIYKADCIPLTLGGDHTLTYPILRAAKEKHGTVALIQIDAHHDLQDEMLEEPVAHGTPFKRALDEKLVDPKKFYQVGLRGSLYAEEEIKEIFTEFQDMGVNMVLASDCWGRNMGPLMDKIRSELKDTPVYLTFDIDAIDPSDCPGTGTPEIAGLTTVQALEIVRGCRGLNIIGADVVEVNSLYDQSGATANMAANLLFEMLCVLPGVKYIEPPKSNFDF